MKLGSLFSGAGGLDLAVQQVFNAKTVWHCELDPAASKVLAHRWPSIPNLGDITQVDWAQTHPLDFAPIEPIDILCGGWPCQPFSLAGKRKGAADERALWPYVARAVRGLRPRYVVLENVSAVLTAGEFQRVANDLAEAGYDMRWLCLRASDVGAPHGRERVFILAHAAEQLSQGFTAGDDGAALDAPGLGTSYRDRSGDSAPRVRELGRGAGTERRDAADSSGEQGRIGDGDDVRAGWGSRRHQPATGRGTAADSSGDGRQQGRPEPARLIGGPDAAVSGAEPVNLLPTPVARDYKGYSTRNHQLPNALLPSPTSSDRFGAGPHGDGGLDLRTTVTLLQTPSTADGGGSGKRKDELLLAGQAREMATDWGKYAPAIAHWEQLAGSAPSPTKPNRNGNPCLNPAFSEWMMGWPAGWVTAVPDISRNNQLKIIGNGVVPQQATAALQWLLNLEAAAA